MSVMAANVSNKTPSATFYSTLNRC